MTWLARMAQEARWGPQRLFTRAEQFVAGALGFRMPEPDPGLAWLTEAWERRAPGVPPVSWLLRSELPATWVRFHSLPESKRYAETEEEYRVLLDRHHRVLEDLRGADQKNLVLIQTRSDADGRFSAGRGFRTLARTTPLWRVIHDADGELEVEGLTYYSFASRVAASSEELDPLLRRVADDQDRAILTNDGLDWLYAPYDGGADVITPSVEVRDRLRDRYADWLSSLPSGL